MANEEQQSKTTDSLDHQLVVITDELRHSYHMQRQIDQLSLTRYPSITPALIAIYSYAQGTTPHSLMLPIERQSSEILALKDISEVSRDTASDPQEASILSAYAHAEDNPIKIKALDTLLDMYVIATEGPLNHELRVEDHIESILCTSKRMALDAFYLINMDSFTTITTKRRPLVVLHPRERDGNNHRD